VIPSKGGTDDWTSRVKEELYSDLSGLLIMNVKKEPRGTLFECLQTGTNGALQFKLSVPEAKDSSTTNKSKNNKAPTASSQNDEEEDEAEDEYVFIPVLNEDRDQIVISLLPEYLRCEISFNKNHATKFYQKINSVLSQKIVSDEDEGEETEEDEEEEEMESTMVDE